jgi:membrane protease YdiL (CAAX protease family)
MDKPPVRAWKMAVLFGLSLPINLLRLSDGWLHRELASLWPALPQNEVAYLTFVGANFLIGISTLALLVAVVEVEKPPRIREFFGLGRVDWPSLGLIALLTFALNILERLFLRRMLFEPVRAFLISIGLWGRPSLEVGFQPPHGFMALNLGLLILVLWIEAPEEVFFRGYIQNHLQDLIGANSAVIAGAAIWSAWHIFAPAEFFRILFYGLAFGMVFRLRQNTTSLAIWHPLSNRLLLIAFLLRGPGT